MRINYYCTLNRSSYLWHKIVWIHTRVQIVHIVHKAFKIQWSLKYNWMFTQRIWPMCCFGGQFHASTSIHQQWIELKISGKYLLDTNHTPAWANFSGCKVDKRGIMAGINLLAVYTMPTGVNNSKVASMTFAVCCTLVSAYNHL